MKKYGFLLNECLFASRILLLMLAAEACIIPLSASNPCDSIQILSEINEPVDSIGFALSMSDEDGNGDSFFNGVLPRSPQATAMARYAEYPVSHTTGVPDISIPLYEIEMGGYVLPVSISYHASGCRVDEVPTCVGLGWCLNAGGAVTRTILGGPDLEYSTIDNTNFKLRDYNYMRGAMNYADPDESVASPVLTGHPEYDTESDRYTLNAGGHNLTFRYSHNDREFVVLNHENCNIRCHGSQLSSGFYVAFPDGTEWTFDEHERSGVDSRGEGMPFVTAWYVTEINTQWGKISFTYRQGERIDFRRYDTVVTAGPRVEADYLGYPVDVIKVDVDQSPYTYSSGQTLVETISWNGNTIYFDYSSPYPGKTTDRLERIRVVSSAGETVRTINFGNDSYWASIGSTLPENGRRMLMSLEDSGAGTYTFEYDKRIAMPSLDFIQPASWSDLYGYFRGVENKSVITRKVMEQLREVCPGSTGTITPIADRNPVEDAVKNGLLKKINYPTGGYSKFEYEVNNADGKDVGGVRIASMTLSDGASVSTRKYSYFGTTTQENPEDLMWCDTYIGVDDIASDIVFYHRRRAFADPSFSALQPSNSAVYMQVVETLPDKSSVTYNYHSEEVAELFGSVAGLNPSLFDGNLIDTGSRLPLLTSRIVADPEGKEVWKEETEYDRRNNLRVFDTGVKTAFEYYNLRYSNGVSWHGLSEFALYGGHFEMRRCTARVRSATVRKKTITDCRSGLVTTTRYTYDDKLRTTQPRTVTVTGSDGRDIITTYTYPFDRAGTDTVCASLVGHGYVDAVIAVNVASLDGGKTRTLSQVETDYGFSRGLYYPVARSSWSMPTKDQAVTIPAVLPERERVSAYNSLGRPLSIKVNETDLTSLTWNERGNLLLSATAPGGLTTTYTHKPLLGLESATQPNGLKLRYEYNSICALSRVFDNLGCLDTYSYSIANHPTGDYTGNGNSIISRHYLTRDGLTRTIDQQYHDGLGRPSVLAKAGGNTSGKYLYSAVTYDNMGRELRSIMPAVGGTTIEAKAAAQVQTMASATYGDSYAYSDNSYDALDRIVKATTPGKAWHDAGEKGKVTEYVGNAANSVRLYSAPMNAISLVENGYYAASTLQGVRTLDEDGNEMTVYTDRLGRKVLERRGPESAKGQNDTYFVYNDLGQLRYVLSPGYELSGYKEKFAYEYRYDEHGNVVKKFIPGGGYTQYWYDRAGRMTFMQDENLRAQNLHRFFIYDRAGRQALQGTAAVCNRSSTVNFADYTGGTSGFQSTGYTLQDATRIQQVTLETVNYYDDYRFASALDSRLTQTAAVSAKGLGTGSVTYNSEGGKSMSAIYYDIRGNVTTLREITDFGTLRVTDNTYTFTNQPLTSKMTESGGVTMLTENTYDTGSGLLVSTDVTINGTKQRVSKVTYDDLGRITSVVRGNGANSGGTVSYSYNLHGQTTSITGPGFTQKLHYTDGPGKPLYNGSISSMLWTMGSDARQRGYKYTYNRYNWLTLAEYGEGATLTTHKDRYTERFSNFMLNGGIRRLQRHGLKADGNYGKIDNLHISYDGNRITTVLEDADAVTQSGSMDYPGKKQEMAFEYNAWGALTKDESRGIKSIEYDNLGNPVNIQLGGGYTRNVYSVSGVKLKTINYTKPYSQVLPGMHEAAVEPQGIVDPGDLQVEGLEKLEYRGPVIYRNGKIDMVLFPGGYATISGTTVTFHYYTQDYLGNNRAVVNGTTGTIEQTTAYYPYGAIIPDLGTGNTGQPFKFGGKELISANGLNMYDFGARLHYPAIPQFDRIDPMCEKFAWLSPYLYCGNNPVNRIDPTGMIWENPEEAEELKNDVENRIKNLQDQNTSYVTYLEQNDNLTEDAKKTYSQLIAENKEKINLLSKSLETMQKISDDKERTYSLSPVDKNSVHGVVLDSDGTINIQTSSPSLALHEITHIGQSLDVGELKFDNNSNMLLYASTKLGRVVGYELKAYRTQFAMDPLNMPLPVVSINSITPTYLKAIVNPYTGNPLYDFIP